ncbi:MAG: IS3 family transposase [Desulfovibrio sp.]|uniref:IS3 family transposase n=1 Tax=Desulfovibrio sp. 7SRBS1 TaxID=3378064 RepID=UPI003B3F8F80
MAKQRGHYPTKVLCKVLSVSRSGYYAWARRKPGRLALKRQLVLAAAQKSYHASRGIYGYRKVHMDVVEQVGFWCCPETVRRVLAAAGLQSKLKRKHRYPCQTGPNPPVAENHLSRQFLASAPNQKWASDITYIPTREGWLYLAVTLDMFSRRVVGWAMSERVDSHLACKALTMAVKSRSPKAGLLHHSDQGCQYTSELYRKALSQNGMVCSMSRRGNCWDNAVAETFFSKLKREWVNWSRYQTRSEAKLDIFMFLEGFYNRKRRHAGIGYKSPVEYENIHQAKSNVAD